jgi:uracil-DNA glycosylase
MTKYPTALPYLPSLKTISAMRKASAKCDGCDLFRKATQTVFGRGPTTAHLVVVGETPGDNEDLEGKPFVGPAGRLLDRVLEGAGIDRKSVYVTNAVKHFRYEERGVRRLHKKPSGGQIEACRPWLLGEIEAIAPRLIVCLGATAAQSLLGSTFRITKSRGTIIRRSDGVPVLASYHPSAVLRAPSPEDRARLESELLEDLRTAANFTKSARLRGQ